MTTLAAIALTLLAALLLSFALLGAAATVRHDRGRNLPRSHPVDRETLPPAMRL